MKFFFMILLFCGVIHPQISITQSDVELTNQVGISSTSYLDTTTASADIGNTGESSWDFSSLTPAWNFTTTSIEPSSSPYGSSFPNSTICRKYTTLSLGFSQDHYLFNHLDANGFYLDANITATQIMITVTSTTTYNPSEEQIRLPLTYGTSWSQDYSYTTVSSTGGPALTTDLHTTYTADAYGQLTLPGGTTLPALRIKRDEISISGETYSRFIGYLFYTKSGHSVSISAADTLQPETGIINIHGASWVLGNITGVKITENSNPYNFGLRQNYPNPFNPATNIVFRIAGFGLVTLKVYEICGPDARGRIGARSS